MTGAILLAAAVAALLQSRGPMVPTTRAVRSDLEQHLVVSGRVRVVTRVRFATPLAGRVVAVGAVEGQRVVPGDVLVQLDDAEARAEVAQAEAGVAQASARVEQLRQVGAVVTSQAMREAEADLVRAEAELARVERLVEAGAATRASLEEARRQAELARARQRAADAQQTAAMPAGADTRLVLGALVESQGRLAAARARLAQMQVVAAEPGIILARLVEPGDAVSAGATLVEMAADGETELVIEPDERNLAWVRLGQRALAAADAFPQTVFDAEVSYIAPAVDPARGSVEVRLRVDEPPDILRPDMTVSVDLTVASNTDVVTLPADAVRGAATATPWVFVVEGGRLARRDVRVGIRGEGSVEIVSGIAPGTEVVLMDGPGLIEGQRVRPRPEVP